MKVIMMMMMMVIMMIMRVTMMIINSCRNSPTECDHDPLLRPTDNF